MPTVNVTPPAIPRPTVSVNPPADRSGGSAPPLQPVPPALASMSPQCKAQLNALLQGADQRDNAKAVAAYEALRANCDSGIRDLAQEANHDLPARKMENLSAGYFKKCLVDPNCGPAPRAKGGAPPAGSFDVGEVLDLAIAFMGIANGVIGIYAGVPGGALGSYGGPVRSTYGQGAPTQRPAPQQRGSTITGGK
jgi:hypothetical protein